MTRWSLRLRLLTGAITLSFFFCAFASAQAAKPGADTPTRPSDAAAQLESKFRETVRQEVANAFSRNGDLLMERAARAEKSAERLLDVVKWVSSGWLAVVTFIFAVLIFIGWREYGLVRTAKDEATKAKDEATKARDEATIARDAARAAATQIGEAGQQVELVRQRINANDQAITQAINDVEVNFAQLPEIERYGIVGEPSEMPPATDIARYEEADILLTIADRNNTVDKARLVLPLIRLGDYWRLIQNYPRAIARLQRAIELSPDSLNARRGFSQALYSAATRKGLSTREKSRLLDRAQEQCAKALEISGRDPGVLFDQGWIYDERGDLEAAERVYREAQALDVDAKRPNITYNLACTLTKRGEYGEALTELQKVIGFDDNWNDALFDPELEPLRTHVDFAEPFQNMIEAERSKQARPAAA